MKYIVKDEDTIEYICDKYSIDPMALAEANGCNNIESFYNVIWKCGEVIEIPFRQKPVVKYRSESLVLGVDFAGDDVSVLTVGRLDGLKVNILNVFYGKKAEDLYNQLLGRRRDDND